MKRVFDFTLAFIALPFALVICLIAALLIRRSGVKSPLFRQERVGRHRKPFILWKLRTMAEDTGDLASHNAPADKITPIGKTLRKYKIDELPQLWNVLRGEMSFVGPRPCLPIQNELIILRDALGVYKLRPGITGPAQLDGIDMSTPETLAKRDADYLELQSLSYDIKAIFRTAFGGGRGDAVGKKTP